ncbi:unnamed protein product [Mycena citricolor]|uniref:VASt domain-containing protein n=1 Tax=Mycena citricolor TaxID=2018698 RepID=A0AAD2K2Z1_9AGAR|nr:unnamed protein product [Mycena citricolor]
MAPNFLSKLVKAPAATHPRDRSLSSSSPISPSDTRSQSPSTVESSSRNGSTLGHSGRSSGNPSVTVIPPSPVVANDASPEHPVPPKPAAAAPPIEGLPATTPSRPPTPKGSKSSQVPTPPPPPLRTQSSNKSLKRQQVTNAQPPAVPNLPDPAASAEVRKGRPELVDSPPPTRSREMSPVSSMGGSPPPSRRDTDVFSVTSSKGGKSKSPSRPWKRSVPKKPVGLAGALAATGLAMANHGMSVDHQTTMNPQVMNTGEASGGGPSLVTSPLQSPQMSARRRATSTASPEPAASRHRRQNTSTSTKSGDKREHRRRQTTGSAVSHEDADEHQGAYYSGLEDSSDGNTTDTEDDDESGLDLDLGEDDIPVTGFAVASNKRNADFHELFPGIPEGDYLIDDYGCALQRDILVQGRIYVSENHLCFHANIFGWVTDLTISIYEITTLEKKVTAFVIPNAIHVVTPRADYTFASFLSRDTTFDVIHNIWRLVRPSDAISIGSGSVANDTGLTIPEGTLIGSGPAAANEHKATVCACGKQGAHFSETALEIVIPGTPERIYNLIFASGFIKEFMAVNQKLTDIQVSDWSPATPGSKLLTRNMSYIKPLNASLGPKSTKCEIRDELAHIDFDDYVSMLTTTRTPDVPSGGVFSVKTRTCIMWCTSFSTKVVVTTQVDWTGRSFIKGIIEKSAIDGQKVYHGDLDKAMRGYIKEHQSEFMPEGVDLAAAAVPELAAEASTAAVNVAEPTEQEKRKARQGRGLQWAWDTFDGAYRVAKTSTKGALELLRDAWDNSNSTSILYVLIFVLLLSNIWTYMRMGSAAEKTQRRHRERVRNEDREEWVAGVVTALWDELSSGKKLPPTAQAPSASLPTDAKAELASILSTLDLIDERVRLVRSGLAAIEAPAKVGTIGTEL